MITIKLTDSQARQLRIVIDEQLNPRKALYDEYMNGTASALVLLEAMPDCRVEPATTYRSYGKYTCSFALIADEGIRNHYSADTTAEAIKRAYRAYMR